MTKRLDSQKMQDLVKEAILLYEKAFSADEQERRLAVEDMAFAFSEDGQWDQLAKFRRRGRPRYTINKVAPAINELIGAYRQNRIELKARPMDDASKDEADTYNGLIRAINSTQEAETAKDVAYKSVCTSGFGAMRVGSRFCDDNPFEQELYLAPIYDSINRVWCDPFAKNMTASDGRFQFEVDEMDRKVFFKKYPKARLTPFPDQQLSRIQRRWGCGGDKKDKVMVADYYRKEINRQEIVLLSNGKWLTASDFEQTSDELIKQRVTQTARKMHDVVEVWHYRISGSEVLEQPKRLPFDHLPIIRVLGFHEWNQGTLHYRGIVRPAKDSQRVYNYATSQNIETVALSPKNKVMATPPMVKGHEGMWNNLNNSDSPLVLYNIDPKAGKPEPMSMAQTQPALIQQAQQAELDLQSTIGRRAPAQGEAPNDKSGRAILALQKQDDATTFELQDNLRKAVEYATEVVIDGIPTIYDTERQIQILGDDNETQIVTLNEVVVDEQTGKEVKLNDTNKKYRVKASVGPAYETKRTEMVNVLSTLAQDDQFKPIIADLFAKAMDFPFSDELTNRVRKVQLQQGIVEPTEEEQAEIQAQQAALQQDPNFQRQQQIKQALEELSVRSQVAQVQQIELTNQNLAANTANIQANAAKKAEETKGENAKTEKTRTDNYKTLVDAFIAKIEAGGVLTMQEQNTMDLTLSLLDASMQEDINVRLGRALQTRQQILGQPQIAQ